MNIKYPRLDSPTLRGLVFLILLVVLDLGISWTGAAENSNLKNQTDPKIISNQPLKFISVQFFPEPPKPVPSDWQPAPATFEGKAFIKNKNAKYVPVQKALPQFDLRANSTSKILQAPQSDIYIQDGSETSIAVNYDNGNNLVATYNEGWNFNPDIPHSNSTDGNLSWTNRSFPNGGGTFTGYPFDPWANRGNTAGEFFSTLIRYDTGSSGNNHCIISRSINSGASFSFFFEQTRASFQDREMVDIDRTTARGGGGGTTHNKKVYLAYDDWLSGGAGYSGSWLQVIDSLGSPVAEYQISGSGASFYGSQMQPVADTGDGRLYIQATAIANGGASIVARFHYLTNGGANLTRDVSLMSWSAAGDQLGTSVRWGVNGHRIDQHGFLDIDRSSGPRRGRLYFISNRNPNPSNSALDQGDIYVSFSSNGAASWSSALIPTASGKTQYFPMLDVDEQGWIHVAYYQNDSGSTNGGVLNASKANLYYTFSTNGGTIWSSPIQVNSASNTLDFNDPPLDLSSANYYLIGDYAQLQATGIDTSTRVYILWSGFDKDRNNSGVGDKKERVYCTTINPFSGCLARAGDANGDNLISLSDIVYIVNYLFKSGPAPSPACRGNANGDGTTNLSDIVYLVNFIFKSGPAPVNSSVCCL